MNFTIYIITALALFYIIRKITTKLFPNLKLAKDIGSGIIAISITPIVAKGLILVFFNILMYEYHPDRKFEVASWEQNYTDRHQMSDDLISSQLLMNMSKADIVKIIGLPNYKVPTDSETLSTWRYEMGSQNWGFGLKFYYLMIDFENNVSANVYIEEAID